MRFRRRMRTPPTTLMGRFQWRRRPRQRWGGEGVEADDPGPLVDENPLVQAGMATEIERFKKFECFTVVTEKEAHSMEGG